MWDCFFFLVKRHLLDEIQPVIRNLREEKELERQHRIAHHKRQLPKVVKKVTEGRISDWQGWYMRGELPDGSGHIDDHQRAPKLKPFLRGRTDRQ